VDAAGGLVPIMANERDGWHVHGRGEAGSNREDGRREGGNLVLAYFIDSMKNSSICIYYLPYLLFI
jgi:hypothetical protein